MTWRRGGVSSRETTVPARLMLASKKLWWAPLTNSERLSSWISSNLPRLLAVVSAVDLAERSRMPIDLSKSGRSSGRRRKRLKQQPINELI